MRIGLLVLVVLGLVGCDTTSLGVEDASFGCFNDVTCGAGFRCVAQRCRLATTCMMRETCGNQLDDDCNGLTDCADVACERTCMTIDAGSSDAGPVDAGAQADSGTELDAGSDGGATDSGTPDAGEVDAGAPDAGTPDAGADAGLVDSGTADAGVLDAGAVDAGARDAGLDAGPQDAGAPDAGNVPGDVCATAVALSSTPVVANFQAARADYVINQPSCTPVSGLDFVYTMPLPSQQLTMVTASSVMLGDVVLNLMLQPPTQCSFTGACIATSDRAGLDGVEALSFLNPAASNVGYLILSRRDGGIVPGSSAAVSAITGPSSTDTCMPSTGMAFISNTTSLTQTFQGSAANVSFPTARGCQYASGADRVFLARVPAFGSLSVDVASTMDVVINIVDANSPCTLGATDRCLTSADSYGPNGPNEKATYENATNQAVFVRVVIADISNTATSASITTTFTIQGPLQQGDMCSLPVTAPVRASTGALPQSMTGMTPTYAFNATSGNNCIQATNTADRVHAFTLSGGQLAEVRLRNVSGFDPILHVLDFTTDACEAVTFCNGSSNAAGMNGDETVIIANAGVVPRTYRAIVSANGQAVSSGSYDYSLFISGDKCLDATPSYIVRESVRLPYETFEGLLPDHPMTGSGCTSSLGGADRAYRLELDSGQRFTATLVPANNFTPVMNLVGGSATSCNGTSCLATSAPNPDGGMGVVLDFTSTIAREAYLVVAARNLPTSTATYDLDLRLSSNKPLGESCANPEPLTLTPGMTRMVSGTTVSSTKDHTMSCFASYLGKDRVYVVDVAPDQRLRVAAPAQFVVDLIYAAAWNCDDWCTSSGQGGEETYFNDTGYPQRIFIVVATAASGGAAYNLGVTLDPAP